VIEIGFFLYRKKKKKENEQVNSMTTLSDVKDDEKKENCEKR
jgi:cbb3-type cytochrome oxidase subunit 3